MKKKELLNIGVITFEEKNALYEIYRYNPLLFDFVLKRTLKSPGKEGKKLPIEIDGQIIYYVGPAPTPPGYKCGSAGPTTSYRMDPYTPALLDLGLKGMIGKGLRSKEVVESMKKNGAVYFAAIGGVAAMIAKGIKSSEVVAYEDLGPEAIHKYYVEDFPAIVCIDAKGNNLYETEPPKYRK